MRRPRRAGLAVLAALTLATSACGLLGPRENDPNRAYARAEERALLEVPPDLSGTVREALVKLPGARDESVARTTLLPDSNGVRLVRDGRVQWLELEVDGPQLWPALKEFLRRQEFGLARDEPLSGIVETEWRALAAPAGGFEKLRLRLERAGTGERPVRVFATHQRVGAAGGGPSRGSDPEREAEVLAQLLVYLGLQEQQARGVLSEEQVQSLSARVRTQEVQGQQTLVVSDTHGRVWSRVAEALENIGLEIEKSVPFESRYEVLFSNELPPSVVAALPEEQRPEDGFFASLFGDDEVEHYYQVYVLDEPGQTRISIADSTGTSKMPALETELLRRLSEELQ